MKTIHPSTKNHFSFLKRFLLLVVFLLFSFSTLVAGFGLGDVVDTVVQPWNAFDDDGGNGGGDESGVDADHCYTTQSFSASAQVVPANPYPYVGYSDTYQTGQTSFLIEENTGLKVTDIASYSALCNNGVLVDHPPYTIAYMETTLDDDREPGQSSVTPTRPLSSEINLGSNNPVQDGHFFCDGSFLWIGGKFFDTLPIPFGYDTKVVKLRFSQNNVDWTPLTDNYAVNVLRNDSFFKSKNLLVQNEDTTVNSVLKMRTNEKLRLNVPVQNIGTTNWLADGKTPNNAVYYLRLYNPAQANLTPAPFILDPLTYTATDTSLIPIYFANYQTREDSILTHPVYNSVIQSGEVANFQFDLTAPSEPGTYQLTMQMTQYGFQNFGETITTTIEVLPAINDATCELDVLGQADEAGKSLAAGSLTQLDPSKKYTLRIDFKNEGNQSWKLNQTGGVGVEFISLNGTHAEYFMNLPAAIPIPDSELADPEQTGVVTFPNLSLSDRLGAVDLSFQANSSFFNGKFGKNCRIQVPIAQSYDAQGTLEIIRVRDGHTMAATEHLMVSEEYEFFVEVTNKGSTWVASNASNMKGLWNGQSAFNGYISLRDGNADYAPPLQEFYEPLESTRHALNNPLTPVHLNETRKSQAITRIPKKAGTITEAFRMIEDHLPPSESSPTRFGEFGDTITRTLTIDPAVITPSCTIDQTAVLQNVKKLYSVRYYDIPPTATLAPQCPTGSVLDAATVRCAIDPTRVNAGVCTYECSGHSQLGIFPITNTVTGNNQSATCTTPISVVVDLTAPFVPPAA